MRTRFVMLLLVVVAIAGETGSADAGRSSRKAGKIIGKYVEAIGGERRILSIDALKCKGYMEQQGVKLSFTMYRARPNMTRMEAQLGPRNLVQSYDGHTAWWTNPFGGVPKPEPLPEALEQSVTRWADFDGPLVRHDRKGHYAEYVTDTTLESGREVHKIKLTLADGDVWYCYIDAETHLEVMRTYDVTYQGQTRVVETEFLDYVDVNGVLLPREVTSEAVDGTKFRMVFTEYDPTADIDPDIFRMPAVDEGRAEANDGVRLAARQKGAAIPDANEKFEQNARRLPER